MPKANASDDFFSDYVRTLIRIKARQLARNPSFSRSDSDDIEQELAVALLKQACKYDPSRGSWNTFAAKVVQTSIGMILRKQRRLKRSPIAGVELQSLEMTVDIPDEPPMRLWALVMQADVDRRTGATSHSATEVSDQASDLAHIIASLPPNLQAICLSLRERSRTATAEHLGISRSQVNTAVETIRQHFERAGLGKI
jgi:RNA polymerase sigma factor (sigma-70 family)